MIRGPEFTREEHLDESDGSRSEIGNSTRIGRFIVLEILGEGGMGTVFAAWDPRLQRRVAIKVLSIGSDDERQRARLLREARAMAKLSDPHVVAVYEAGVHRGCVFVAMELVEGKTLRQWLSANRPTWRDVLLVFEEAGRGLATAHAAGLVHRDFKPDNVLIADAHERGRSFGRVRVADFGLARDDLRIDAAQPSNDTDTADVAVTRDGIAAGTPAYMAPEQFMGGPIDERTDQFAFCVALWEALHGERPFEGHTRFELADAIVHGRLRAPSSRDIPTWLHAEVERGLAVVPDGRHPSMTALLEALHRDPARRRRRIAGSTAVAGVGLSLVAMARGAPEPRPCTDSDAHLSGVWDDARRSELRAAFAQSEATDALRHADQTIAALDGFARRWVDGHRDACEATSVRGEQSTEVLDLRTRCLWRRRQNLSALADLLTRADEVVVEHAIEAAADLPAPEACADLDFVSQRTEPPHDSATEARVEMVREQLARIEAQRKAGLVQAARLAAEALLPVAYAIDHAPVRAEAGVVCGAARNSAGAPAEAEEILTASYFEAAAAGDDDTAASAAGLLVYVVGHALGREIEGMHWAAHARAIGSRPGVDPFRAIRLALDVSTVHLAFARYDDAERELVDAIARLRSLGTAPVQLAIALNSLGGVAISRGRFDEATAPLHEARSIVEHELGDRHPFVATMLQNLGIVAWHREDYEGAIGHQLRALEIQQAALQPDHPDIVSSLLNLAGTWVATQDFERARALLEQAIDILERRDDQLPLHANALHNLAVVQRALGVPEARDTARQALAALQRLLGSDHLEVARAHANLGWILLENEEGARAEPHFARTVAIRESAQAPLGDVADARFGLADAQWASARHDTAVTTARTALDEARRAGASEQALVDRIAAWLRDRGHDAAVPALPL